MSLKEKIIGVLLIIVGVVPLLLKIPSLKDNQYLNYLIPGDIIYQAILIILGIILLYSIQVKRN